MSIKQTMLHKLKPGMTIAEDIYNNSQLVIPADTEVSAEVIDILQAASVVAVPIYEDEDSTDSMMDFLNALTPEPPKDTRSEKIRKSPEFKKFEKNFEETTKDFSNKMNDVVFKQKRLNIDEILASTDKLLDGQSNVYHLMDILSNIHYFDDSTYAHSLNVAMLANVLGKWLNLRDQDLRLLTAAGLLHDIGKILLPPEVIKKPGKLTDAEYNLIKQHPYKGYQLLSQHNIDPRIAQAALLHHEKCDGTGYPLGVTGSQISDLAKILTIVDIYEAMTANRCYREGLCPFEAIRAYEREGYQKYDAQFLVPFLRGICDTYLHNTVQLNDGRKGEIITTNVAAISRPGLMIDGVFVDLSKEPDLEIVAIV